MNHAYNKALLIVLKESQNVTFGEHELMAFNWTFGGL